MEIDGSTAVPVAANVNLAFIEGASSMKGIMAIEGGMLAPMSTDMSSTSNVHVAGGSGHVAEGAPAGDGVAQVPAAQQDLDAMLQRHLNNNPWVYNEIVVDAHAWVPSLPNGVVAFFYEAGQEGSDCIGSHCQAGSDCVARHQQNFIQRFALEPDERPILQLDLGMERPFALGES